MSIQLTDEQLMIQSMVRDFAREVLAPTASERDKNKAFPAENLKRLAEEKLPAEAAEESEKEIES